MPRRNVHRVSRVSFEQRLDRFPPVLIRLLTVFGRRPNQYAPDDHEIARASGLSIEDVKRISYSRSWDPIPVGQMYLFMRGCGIDLEKRRTFRRLEWMRHHGAFRHLRKSELWGTQFRELIELLPDPPSS
jgi:hypothetical protein